MPRRLHYHSRPVFIFQPNFNVEDVFSTINSDQFRMSETYQSFDEKVKMDKDSKDSIFQHLQLALDLVTRWKKKHVDFLCRLQNPGLRVVSSTIQAKSKPEIIEIWPIFPHHHMPQLSHTLSAHIANETTSYPSSILNHPKCGISSGWISDPSKSNLQDLFLHYVSKQPVELGSSNTRWRLRFVPAMQALVSPRRWWRSSIPLVTQKATTMGSDDTTVSHAEMENARVTQELAHIVILIKKHSAQLEKFIPYLPLFHTEWLLPCDVDTLTKLDKMH